MKSIRTKLIVSTLSIAAAIAVVLSLISIISINTVISNAFDSLVSPLADQSAATVTTYVQTSIDGLVVAVSDTKLTKATTNADAVSYLYTQMRATSATEFSYFSNKGELIYASNDEAKGFKDNPAVAILDASDDMKYITSDVISDGNGKCYYLVIVKVIDKSDKVIGKVLAAFDFIPLNNLTTNINFSKNGNSYLMDKNGAIITNKEIAELGTENNPIKLAETDKSMKSTAQLHNDIIVNKNGIEKIKIDGKEYIAGYSYIETLDKYIVLTAPVTDFVNKSSVILISVVAGVLLMLVASLVTSRMTKKISLPIINISQRLKTLSEGNLSDPVPSIKTKDEIGELADALGETISSLKVYVGKITTTLKDIADGNLTDRVHGSFRGDFIQIKSTFNTILESLIDTFTNINTASEEVNSGANQVSNGAQALSQGATEQASAIQELSATIADVSHQITSNAKASKSAEQYVDKNAESILLCNKDMASMLKSMDEINVSSNEISKIIKVIDDIAFQTNILALNAAVEAARAGSAGKGFAVVADEVRSLAAKSAEAAKQTTSLIEGSFATVTRGTKIAKQTAKALNEIVESTNEINKLVKNISKASENQADSIIQINTGIEQISGVVQTNTATAEESAAASEELSGQSQTLRNMISKFRLGNKEELFGSNAKHWVGKNADSAQEFKFESSASTDNSGGGFSFGSTFDDQPSGGFKFEQAPADEPAGEFSFGNSFNDEPKSDFKFEQTPDDEPAGEFSFGNSFNDETKSEFNFNEQPSSGFKFEQSPDDEPVSEFKFGSSFDDEPSSGFKFEKSPDEEPASEFKFSNDLKINLDDDEDSKY